MYRILSSSKDSYITNRIVNGARATDANIGQSGTLDLFKLYDESTISGEDTPVELSKILIKFNLDPLRDLVSASKINLNETRCFLRLFDVYGGQTTPEKFHLTVFPLSKSFDEGSGFDISSFRDIGVVNYLTASARSNSVTPWSSPGASASGSLGESGIDVIVSGTLIGPSGSSYTSLSPVQYFESGYENLFLDVSHIISGTITSQIPDCGFLIAFSGSYEKDDKSYFVKRFASRNTINENLRPRIQVMYDDSIQDHHLDMTFDITGSLFMTNYYNGVQRNVIGPAGEISGSNCMLLKIESGSFKYHTSASSHTVNQSVVSGLYRADVCISSFSAQIKQMLQASGSSITFNEIWSTPDQSNALLSSSIEIEKTEPFAYRNSDQILFVNVTNLRKEYKQGDYARIRVFVDDKQKQVSISRLPFENTSLTFHNMHYRIKDNMGNIVVDFDTVYNSTRLSTDSIGMYFDLYIDFLPTGRTFHFEFLVKKEGFDIIVDAPSKFAVV